MPFTPFHMGPGAAIKAVAGHGFSLTVFGFAQVAIDVEPLIRMLRRDEVLHGFSHTWLGATLIGTIALLAGRPLCRRLLGLWNGLTAPRYLRWLQVRPDISWIAGVTGAFVGTYSHILLDSVMHSDMKPWSPFSSANGLLYVMPIGWLHLLCAGLGAFGLLTIAVVGLWNRLAVAVE